MRARNVDAESAAAADPSDHNIRALFVQELMLSAMAEQADDLAGWDTSFSDLARKLGPMGRGPMGPGTPDEAPPKPASASGSSVRARLEELNGLRTDGLLSQEEYDQKRAQILSEL